MRSVEVQYDLGTSVVWGINTADQVFYRRGIPGEWRQIPGSLRMLKVQPNGRVWGISPNQDIFTRAHVDAEW